MYACIITIYYIDCDYNYNTIGYVNQGGFFGDFEFISKTTRASIYTAATRCRFLAVPYSTINKAMTENCDAGVVFRQTVTQRLEQFHKLQHDHKELSQINPNNNLQTISNRKNSINNKTANRSKLHQSLESLSIPKPLQYMLKITDSKSTTQDNKKSLLYSTHPSLWIDGVLQSMEQARNFDLESLRQPEDAQVFNQEAALLEDHFNLMTTASTAMKHKKKIETQSHMNEPNDNCNSEIDNNNSNNNSNSDEENKSTRSSEHLINTKTNKSKSNRDHHTIGRMEVIVEETISGMTKYNMLHPEGYRKNTFDLFIGGLIMFSVLWVPVAIGFDVKVSSSMSVAYYIIDFFFFLDMCLSFRTVYFSKDDDAYIAIPAKVYTKYLHTWFLIDFISFFPFSEIVEYATGSGNSSVGATALVKMFRLLRLLKLFRFLNTIDYRGFIQRWLHISPVFIQLLETVSSVFFLSHMVACLWWGITSTQDYAW